MSRYDGRLPMNYEEGKKLLRGRHVRTLVNNTRIAINEINVIHVMHHGSIIAAFHPDGRAYFTTARYGSISTHHRLNAMTPPFIRFRSEQGVPHVEIVDRTGMERVSTNHHALVWEPGTGWTTESLNNHPKGI